jgi:hypothetical protein
VPFQDFAQRAFIHLDELCDVVTLIGVAISFRNDAYVHRGSSS